MARLRNYEDPKRRQKAVEGFEVGADGKPEIIEFQPGLRRNIEQAKRREKLFEEMALETEEAQSKRNEQGARMEQLVPKFVLENPEKLADPEHPLWVEPGSIVEQDLSGFTATLEEGLLNEEIGHLGREGDKMSRTIGEVFGVLKTDLEFLGGDIVCTGGDSLTVVFTGPNHEARAKLYLERSMERIESHPELDMSAGMASGDIAFGRVDLDDKRSLPVVLGQPVVDARKLEKQAVAGQILVSTTEGVQTMEASGGNEMELIGDYWQKKLDGRSVDSSDGQRKDYSFEEIKHLSKFLHPHHIWSVRNEGIPASLYDGEVTKAGIVFVRLAEEPDYAAMVNAAKVGEIAPEFKEYSEVSKTAHTVAGPNWATVEKAVGSTLVLASYKDEAEAFATRLGINVVDELKAINVGSSAGVSSGKVYRGMTTNELGFIGTAGNEAARLAAKAAAGTVLVEKYTQEAASNRLIVRSGNAEQVQLKGFDKRKIEASPVFSVEDLGASIEHVINHPLIDREVELALSNAVIQETIDTGTQRVLVIEADAGLGKSTLSDRIIHEHYRVANDVDVFKGNSYPYKEDEKYYMWRGVSSKLFNIQEGMRSEEAVEQVQRVLAEADPQYVQYAELLVDSMKLASIELPKDSYFQGFDEKMIEMYVAVLKRKAEEGTLLVAMEDLHWADPSSLALLKEVLRETRDSAIIFQLVSRPKEGLVDQLRSPENTTTKVELGPISKEQWGEYILAHYPIHGMREYLDLVARGENWRQALRSEYKHYFICHELIEKTYDVTGGNPLDGKNLVNLLIHYHERYGEYKGRINPATQNTFQFFKEEEGEYFGVDAINEVVLQDANNTEATFRELLKSLSYDEQRILRLVWHFGRDFETDGVAEIAGIGYQEVNKLLERAQQLGLLERSLDVYHFAHAKAYEAVGSTGGDISLFDPKEGREVQMSSAQISRLVGEIIERDHPERLEDLARLFGSSDDYLKGMYYNHAYGKSLVERQDTVSYDLAINSFEKTIKIFASQEDKFTADEKEQAVRIVLDAYYAKADAAYYNREYKVAFEVTKEALRLCDRHGQEVDNIQLAECLRFINLQIRILMREKEHEMAIELIDKNNALAVEGLAFIRSDHPDASMITHNSGQFFNMWGSVLNRVKRMDEALNKFQIAGDTSMATHDYEEYAASVANSAGAYLRQGRPDKAAALQESILTFEESKISRRKVIGFKVQQAEMLRRRAAGDDLEIAERQLVEALEYVRDWAPTQELTTYGNMINLKETQDDYEGALMYVNQALDLISEKGPKNDLATYVAEKVYILAKLGLRDQVIRESNVDMERLGDDIAGNYILANAIIKNDGYLNLGVRELYEEARRRLEDSAPMIYVDASMAYARFLKEDLGKTDEAIAVLSETKPVAEATGEWAEVDKINTLLSLYTGTI